MVIQLIAIIAFIFFVAFFSGAHVIQLIDLPSLLALLLLSVPTIIAAGQLKNSISAIRIGFDKNKKYTLEELKNAGDALKYVMIIPVLCSFCITVIGVVAIICNLEDKAALAVNLLLSFLPMFYSVIFVLFLLPFHSKITLLQNKAFGLEY